MRGPSVLHFKARPPRRLLVQTVGLSFHELIPDLIVRSFRVFELPVSSWLYAQGPDVLGTGAGLSTT